MSRFTLGLRVLLACGALWVSQAAVAPPSARAEVSCVASAEACAPKRVKVVVRVRAGARPLPDPRVLREHGSPGRCRRQAVAPPRGERIYLRHCVLQR